VELVTTRLVTAPWVAAASLRLAARLGTLTRWDAAPWIQWDRDLASFAPAKWIAQHAGEVVLRTSDFPAQISAARAGLGLMLAPAPYVAVSGLVEIGYVARLAPSWPNDDLWLVGHKALREVPRVAAVWEWLVAEFRAIGGP
jgi:DNA-binding transcriptional LysR family regulator